MSCEPKDVGQILADKVSKNESQTDFKFAESEIDPLRNHISIHDPFNDEAVRLSTSVLNNKT
jgi:hypothetical protein